MSTTRTLEPVVVSTVFTVITHVPGKPGEFFGPRCTRIAAPSKAAAIRAAIGAHRQADVEEAEACGGADRAKLVAMAKRMQIEAPVVKIGRPAIGTAADSPTPVRPPRTRGGKGGRR